MVSIEEERESPFSKYVFVVIEVIVVVLLLLLLLLYVVVIGWIVLISLCMLAS